MNLSSRTPGETERIGYRLAAIVRPPDLLCLRGSLGAGKTTLVRGLHRGMGCSGRVRSPSFLTLVEYHGRIPLYHFDLYRYEAAGAAFFDEFADWLDGDGVSVVEWADRFGDACPLPHLEIHITEVDAGRGLVLSGVGGDWPGRLAGLDPGDMGA